MSRCRVCNLLILLALAGWLGLAGCQGRSPVTPTPTPIPTLTPTPILSTPMPAGQLVEEEGLQVRMETAELSGEYTDEYGTPVKPLANYCFLWVRVALKNPTAQPLKIPRPENFSLLFLTTEIKPSYGHRLGYPDYFALNSRLYTDQAAQGWLRFQVPSVAQVDEMMFVYNPWGITVDFKAVGSDIPWLRRPLYIWRLD